jgi:hypothetical protein
MKNHFMSINFPSSIITTLTNYITNIFTEMVVIY